MVEVTIGPDGTVTKIKILDTLDEATSASVSEAVQQWRFQELSAEGISEKYPRVGEILFRFAIRGGRPTVIDLAAEELAGKKRTNEHDAKK